VEVPADYGLDYRAASQSSLVEPTLTLPPVARGFGPHTPAVKRILQSPYARTYRLARQLGAGSPTTYDAVVRVQSYLRSHYSYDERPPARQYPLPAFLFQDRIGYCQQFSGAMALLLRMNGIPARVAAGFAPGERQSHGTYEIRDTDAHSWVEVWFSGIGWVPFDPTPASAPAISGTISTTPTAQLGAEGAAAQLRRADTIALRRGHVNPGGVGPTRGGGSAAAPRARGVREAGAGTPTLALGLALAALAGVALARWAWRQRARLASLGEVDEVRAAFAAAGRPVGGATLSELADRLEREGHPRAARYLTALRERRYAPAPAVRRERRARGALRTAVSRGKGPGARIRAWLAVPPRLRPR
jgi:hypothetical protein